MARVVTDVRPDRVEGPAGAVEGPGVSSLGGRCDWDGSVRFRVAEINCSADSRTFVRPISPPTETGLDARPSELLNGTLNPLHPACTGDHWHGGRHAQVLLVQLERAPGVR